MTRKTIAVTFYFQDLAHQNTRRWMRTRWVLNFIKFFNRPDLNSSRCTKLWVNKNHWAISCGSVPLGMSVGTSGSLPRSPMQRRLPKNYHDGNWQKCVANCVLFVSHFVNVIQKASFILATKRCDFNTAKKHGKVDLVQLLSLIAGICHQRLIVHSSEKTQFAMF